MRGHEKRRLDRTRDAWIREQIAAHVETLSARINEVDRLLAEVIRTFPDLGARATLLSTARRVGPVLTTTLLAETPELGTLSASAAAALTGTPPFARERGRKTGTNAFSH